MKTKNSGLMGGMVGNWDCMYGLFRIAVGLMFAQHGAQKLFGWFGDKAAVELFSLMGFAGFVELFGGLAVALGIFTRLAAFGSSAIMVGAYTTVHMSNGLMPIVNRGELALLYLACFLLIMVKGSQTCSLEKKLLGKEYF